MGKQIVYLKTTHKYDLLKTKCELANTQKSVPISKVLLVVVSVYINVLLVQLCVRLFTRKRMSEQL